MDINLQKNSKLARNLSLAKHFQLTKFVKKYSWKIFVEILGKSLFSVCFTIDYTS